MRRRDAICRTTSEICDTRMRVSCDEIIECESRRRFRSRRRTDASFCECKLRDWLSFRRYTGLFLIAEYAIKPYIPRIWLNFLDFLAAEGDTKKFWAKPVSTVSQKCECSIVVTTPHPDTMRVLVENNRRCNDNVELSGRNNKSSCWFPYAHIVLCEFRVFEYFAKDHLPLLAQNRYENALVCAPCGFDDFTCIDFVIHRQVTANKRTCVKLA